MSKKPATFDSVLGRVPSGIFILTVGTGSRATGMLSSWVMQAGFEPPMITVGVKLGRFVCDWLTEGQPFVLNLVGESQNHLLKHFGKGFEPDAPAFEGLEITHCARGVPLLKDAVGHLECEPIRHVDSGDHRIFLAKVVRGRLNHSELAPMVHIRKSGAKYWASFMQRSDLIIIGGGIVGLATAYRFLERFPGKTVTVLEKEDAVAKHQTGRNSGVLHSGVYYRPGSLRAINCRLGKEAMEEFCPREGLPYDRCGKVVVATEERLLPKLEQTLANGTANGVRCERIGPERLREIEPHCAGIAAIHVPEAGVTDYAMVARRLAEIITKQGSRVVTSALVTAIRRDTNQAVVESAAGEFAAEQVVNCAGLYSDRVTRLSGVKPSALILPFRGEFYTLKPEACRLVRALIYPIGDPNFPFLGVHFTKIVHGGFECGPNAVLAFAREGYRNTDVNLRDIAEWAGYIGSWRMALKHWRMGFEEMWRSFSKAAFVRSAQKLIPEIKSEDLNWAPAGVRAQAVSRQGDIIDDWIIDETDRVINVENAPSPAATASLNVGRLVVERLAPRFT